MESGINNNSLHLTRPRLCDGLVLVLLVALTVLSPRLVPVPSGGDSLLVRAGESVSRIALDDEGRHTVKGPLGEAAIVVRDGQAWLENAPCPLKICEGMGPVKKTGDVIICIPNRIYIRVGGKEKVDAVSR